MDQVCEHLRDVEIPAARTPNGCEECLAMDSRWVYLRLCLDCGHVGCCDSSPNKHARAHAAGAGHPAVQSFEPDQDWGYCFPDDSFVEHL